MDLLGLLQGEGRRGREHDSRTIVEQRVVCEHLETVLCSRFLTDYDLLDSKIAIAIGSNQTPFFIQRWESYMPGCGCGMTWDEDMVPIAKLPWCGGGSGMKRREEAWPH